MNKQIKRCASAMFCASVLFTGLAYANGENSSDSDAGGHAEDQLIFKASPEQVLRQRKLAIKQQEAIYKPITRFTEKSNRYVLTMKPEDPTPVVNLLYLSPSTVSFTDATGKPWPILKSEITDGGFIKGVIIDNEFDNSLVLYNSIPAGVAHITVFLKGKDIPIIIRVQAKADNAIYNKLTTIQINDLGPLAEVSSTTLQQASQIGYERDPDVDHALHGVKPYGSEVLTVSVPNALAWRKDGTILLRTKMNVFSPKILRVQAGQSGYTGYRLVNTSRVMAVNESGKIVEIKVSM